MDVNKLEDTKIQQNEILEYEEDESDNLTKEKLQEKILNLLNKLEQEINKEDEQQKQQDSDFITFTNGSRIYFSGYAGSIGNGTTYSS